MYTKLVIGSGRKGHAHIYHRGGGEMQNNKGDNFLPLEHSEWRLFGTQKDAI